MVVHSVLMLVNQSVVYRFKMIKISYAITVCDEYIELNNLLTHLLKNIDLSIDEIVVLHDITKSNDQVNTLCNDHANYGNIKYYADKFDNHFANWKNKLKKLCSKEYIFQIDADEIPNQFLLQHIKTILSQNSVLELLWVPRENYVAGLTQDHIIKWNWNLDVKQRINFPDYQARILKNLPHIVWQNKVHEIIVGATAQGSLPPEPQFCLLHEKTITKQEKQNSYYDGLS